MPYYNLKRNWFTKEGRFRKHNNPNLIPDSLVSQVPSDAELVSGPDVDNVRAVVEETLRDYDVTRISGDAHNEALEKAQIELDEQEAAQKEEARDLKAAASAHKKAVAADARKSAKDNSKAK